MVAAPKRSSSSTRNSRRAPSLREGRHRRINRRFDGNRVGRDGRLGRNSRLRWDTRVDRWSNRGRDEHPAHVGNLQT